MATFVDIQELYFNKNDCVDAQFAVEEVIRISNRSLAKLIETILFPLCDGKTQNHIRNTNVTLQIWAVIAGTITLLVLVPFLIFKWKLSRRIYPVNASDSDFQKLWRDYVNSTTIHGIRYMGERNSHLMERFGNFLENFSSIRNFYFQLGLKIRLF
jgi:hypothetical protein